MLESMWSLVVGVLASAWGLLSTVACFVSDVLVWLHVEMPRFEGLLVGVLLAWLLVRRDKHPLLRAASAPLKLVLDILDLAWNQAAEVASDLWNTAKDWTLGSIGWAFGKVGAAHASLMGKLKSAKDNLAKEEQEK